MAEHFLKTDIRNTSALEATFIRGFTFVRSTDQNSIDRQRDDTLTRMHDHTSLTRRTTDDSDCRQCIIQQTEPTSCYDDEDDDRANALSGLALARIQHRAKKSTANGHNTATQRLQERRGSNPDRSTRLTGDDLTSHMTSDITSHKEGMTRTIERPTSSWASKSGRRPNFTESGWDIEDEDFVGSRIEKMAVNESNSYTFRRASVNEAPCYSPQSKGSLAHQTGKQEKLSRRASDSSRARSYKEVAKELLKESHKKKDENNHSNGSSSNHGISMTDGELARMRAVSRLSHATNPQLTSESTSTMASTVRHHLPRKLDPLYVGQVSGTEMALEEEEEEERGAQMARQHKSKGPSLGYSDEPGTRRRGSREQDSSAMLFSDLNTTEKNIIRKAKLKPIARK